jgi:catechol 2,3-dioxygenase-like lactoylglutathione lyase family enzyme
MIAGAQTYLPVSDLSRALRFYIETLGLKLLDDEQAEVKILDAGNDAEIVLCSTSNLPSNDIRLALRVRDFDGAIAIFGNRGVNFTMRSAGRARAADFKDTEGNRLTLVAAT